MHINLNLLSYFLEDLKLTDHNQMYGIFHPISAYEAIFTSAPLSLPSVDSTNQPFRNGVRSISSEDKLQEVAPENTGHHRCRGRLIFKKRQRAKTERSMRRSVKHHRRRFKTLSSSSSALHKGYNSTSNFSISAKGSTVSQFTNDVLSYLPSKIN